MPSVLGGLVLATGRGAREWVRSLGGFEVLGGAGDESDGGIHAGSRGAVQSGTARDGTRWMALADLLAGDLEDGARILDGASHDTPQRRFRGRFAQIAWHPRDGRVAAVTDHFATLPLYVLATDDAFAVSTDLRVLCRAPWCRREIDLASVYDYLNFACIPAPKTIFERIQRMLPSTVLRRDGTEHRYWIPEYPEDLRGSDEELARGLRDRIVRTVEEYGPEPPRGWGCFLSGGTDSSSVVTILARRAKRSRAAERVKSFSIGFAEARFDELEFARLAANACDADGEFATVSRVEAQALVTRIVDDFDQPFGNASAIPTLACTDLAKARGVDLLLAGDGGDEIFGGNERYAKDRVMETWYSMPSSVRSAGLAAGRVVGGSSIHFLNRIENFFERASLPNPERFYTDDSFASDLYDDLLTPEVRAEVPRDASLDVMRRTFRLGETGGRLHRVMRLDLLMAIAQNDIPKVHGAARSAGVSVRFPLLDPELVEHTCRLEERHKVRGLSKRYLFKRAMRDILPPEILKKKKQGFGLPVGIWLRTDAAFRDLVRDVLLGARASARGWFRRGCVEALFTEHERGGWDHADPLWRLFVLELWLRRYADAA
jgi:asparagine synthase (glutamine-hydrolysing)